MQCQFNESTAVFHRFLSLPLDAPLDVRTEAQKQVSASVGSTVTLVCEVDSNPSASYQWYRSNVQVSSQKEYTFSLSSLALLGSYTCRASNSLGTQDLRFTVSQGTTLVSVYHITLTIMFIDSIDEYSLNL